jgi:hypothetical protein
VAKRSRKQRQEDKRRAQEAAEHERRRKQNEQRAQHQERIAERAGATQAQGIEEEAWFNPAPERPRGPVRRAFDQAVAVGRTAARVDARATAAVASRTVTPVAQAVGKRVVTPAVEAVRSDVAMGRRANKSMDDGMEAHKGKLAGLEGLSAFSSTMSNLGGVLATGVSKSVEMAGSLNAMAAAAADGTVPLTTAQTTLQTMASDMGLMNANSTAFNDTTKQQLTSAASLGTAWDNLKMQFAIAGAQLMGALAPALSIVFVNIQPLIKGIQWLAEWFQGLSGGAKENVVFIGLLVGGFVALAAVVAPLIVAVIGIGTVLGSLGAPIAAVIAAVALLAAAWLTFGDKLKAMWAGAPSWVREAATQMVRAIIAIFTGDARTLGDAGMRLMRAFADGIAAGGRYVRDKVLELLGWIRGNTVGKSPPPQGPLSTIDRGGAAVTEAWGDGLLSQEAAVAAAGTHLAARFQSSLALDGNAMAALTVHNAAVQAALQSSAAGPGYALPAAQPIGAALPIGAAVSLAGPGVSPAAVAVASATTGTTQPAEGDSEDGKPAEKTGMLESFFQFDKMLGSVKTQFTDLMGSISPLAIVSTVLEGVFKGLQPAIDALKEPLRIVGEILGAALAPILEALFPVFKMIAIAATWVGQIFFTIAGAILTTVGALVKGLGKLISKLPGVGDFGLVKVGDGLINMGKGFKDSAKALAEGREKIKALEFGKTAEATQQTAEAATQANEALRNLPSGFKIALARYQVTTGEPVGLATATLPTGASTGAVAQDNRVTVQGNIVIQGADKDGRQLWEEMQREMQRQSLRQNGTTLGYAVAI